MSRYDVVTLGETMMRLAPPGHLRFEQTSVFEIEPGGTESNMAVGLSRLGMSVAWLSRLPANALGRRIARTLQGNGVDVEHIVWAPDGRLGTFFVEFGDGARPTQVIYDRAESAMARMQPRDLPADLFAADRARHLHLTGITLAISDSAAATAQRAYQLAREAGWSFSFDVNYRAKLWSPEESREGCHALASAADLLFLPLRDSQTIYGVNKDAEAEEALEHMASLYPQATIVLTMGAEGSIGKEPDGSPVRMGIFPAGTVGRIGGGDAFTAGVLYQYLQQKPDSDWLAEALRWGAAAASFKYTIPGDMGLFEREEIEALLASGGSDTQVQR